MAELTAIILTHNEAGNITACIEHLRWADSILVFDSFSTDATPELVRSAGVQVIQHSFENYGAQRNAALKATQSEWVFFVDADERVSPALAQEIRLRLGQAERGWWVPRHNYIFGKLTLGAGWYPDYQLRVLHRASARYDPAYPVHETVILDGIAGYLETPLEHQNYRDVAHFLEKQERYTDIEARRRFDLGMIPKFYTYLSGPVREFTRRFITLKGYRDGLHGLRLSLLMAYFDYQAWRRVSRLAGHRAIAGKK